MSQSRRASLIEACINVAVGLGVSTLANALILPLYGMPFSWSAFTQISVLYTLLSLGRSYLLRRFFNLLHSKGILV
jgi:hypothetical protein